MGSNPDPSLLNSQLIQSKTNTPAPKDGFIFQQHIEKKHTKVEQLTGHKEC